MTSSKSVARLSKLAMVNKEHNQQEQAVSGAHRTKGTQYQGTRSCFPDHSLTTRQMPAATQCILGCNYSSSSDICSLLSPFWHQASVSASFGVLSIGLTSPETFSARDALAASRQSCDACPGESLILFHDKMRRAREKVDSRRAVFVGILRSFMAIIRKCGNNSQFHQNSENLALGK